jgi:hypothetical protein
MTPSGIDPAAFRFVVQWTCKLGFRNSFGKVAAYWWFSWLFSASNSHSYNDDGDDDDDRDNESGYKRVKLHYVITAK